MLAVNTELEQRILHAPEDLDARSVYADWLQEQGDVRGTYAALATRGDRMAAWRFLDDHRDDILGGGSVLLSAGWVDWFGGFADEIRIAGNRIPRGALSHPTFRFVRSLALRDSVRDDHFMSELRAARPRLLESVSCMDPGSVERLDGLGIRRFGIAASSPIEGELHGVEELVFTPSDEVLAWIRGGGCPGARNVREVKTSGGTAELLERFLAVGRDGLRLDPEPGWDLARAWQVMPKEPADACLAVLAAAVTFPIANGSGPWLQLAKAHLAAGNRVDAEIAARECLRRERTVDTAELQRVLRAVMKR